MKIKKIEAVRFFPEVGLQTLLSKGHKTVCFDIDGTICTAEKPGEYSGALPFIEMIGIINKLYDAGYTIYLYTGRHMLSDKITKAWLKMHKVNYHQIFYGKPVAEVYVDDRAMQPGKFIKEMGVNNFDEQRKD